MLSKGEMFKYLQIQFCLQSVKSSNNLTNETEDIRSNKMSAPMKRFMPGENNGNFQEEKRSTVQDKDSKRDKCVSWTVENNFKLTDKVVVRREGSCAQYGMIATEDIQEGEVLFQIPRACLITPETCAIANCLSREADSIKGSSGWAPLLIALMYEYNNPESHWRPYLDLVPDFKELDLPMFWSSEERKSLLHGTGVDEAVNKDLDNIEKEFNDIILPFVKQHNDKFSQVCEDIEFYKKMVAFVMSYSFTEHAQQEEEGAEKSGNPPPMMVPMADILNHVAENNAHLNFEKEALKMVAEKNIKKGEEVYNTYGELSNFHLLHMYGFAEEYPKNHWDTVTVSIKDMLEASKQLKFNTEEFLSKKKDFFNDMYDGEGNIVLGASGVLEEEDMVTALKVCCAETADALEEIAEGYESDDDVEYMLFDFESFIKLPDNWRTVLRRCGELSLQRYRTYPGEEEATTKDPTLSSRKKYSLYTAHGQKKILQNMIDSCGR